MTKSSLYGFAVLRNPDAALSDEEFSWAKVCNQPLTIMHYFFEFFR